MGFALIAIALTLCFIYQGPQTDHM